MNTRSPIATISYNTNSFLIKELNSMIADKLIEFWAFVEHVPEEDEKKIHKHLYVVPSSTVDTFRINERLSELDINNPNLPPLGCIRWVHSKFADWYLYAIHDRDYLATKQEERKYHYEKSDIVVSDSDYFNELIHTCDFSKYKMFAKFRDSVSSGVSFKTLFSNGFIPVQQIIQWKKAYNLMRFGDMDYDERTVRGGRKGHEDDIFCGEYYNVPEDKLPFIVDENGEIIPEK